jgi:hypothetical protein
VSKTVEVELALINEDGKVISKTIARLQTSIGFALGKPVSSDYHRRDDEFVTQDMRRGVYYIVDTAKLEIPPTEEKIIFGNVNANDITDNLTVKIISVNGINAETASRTGYIRISSEP